ncbi:hypothetical protein [Amycolatopsis sp. SID8362]|uniref:hypothetical protein n=1 Tax=Amycolatopsis sp. SID8362 TaxID=2690346 RepID=UPI00136AC8F6|nr:hypothetical protein [Amycolatopsis sp. SID8362]NBH04309.1 hypothetical protein [Amycolatopsis sp. SID8362]NED41008.1 hypothetical protein [Amycolatopsis sp. SID8362]
MGEYVHPGVLTGLLREFRAGLGPYPAVEVAHHVQTVGVDFLDAKAKAELDLTRRSTQPGTPAREQLNCLLAKEDGRYSYDTYLTLPLLRAITPANTTRRTSAAALIVDMVRFELSAFHGDHARLPQCRPDPGTVRKRVSHAMRHLTRHDFTTLPAVADLFGREAGLRCLDGVVADADREFLALLPTTVQPVSPVHDEYMFIRVLQGYESVFDELVDHAAATIASLRAADLATAVLDISHATEALERASLLFSLLATMTRDTFHAFRDRTEGSSAIQSAQYKRFEALCDTPSEERLRSDAFGSVPAVRAEVLAGQDTIAAAYRAMAPARADEREAFTHAQARLEAAHQRWKSTHHKIAVRMIGDRPGSGYTAGTPYLKDRLDGRLFSATRA